MVRDTPRRPPRLSRSRPPGSKERGCPPSSGGERDTEIRTVPTDPSAASPQRPDAGHGDSTVAQTVRGVSGETGLFADADGSSAHAGPHEGAGRPRPGPRGRDGGPRPDHLRGDDGASRRTREGDDDGGRRAGGPRSGGGRSPVGGGGARPRRGVRPRTGRDGTEGAVTAGAPPRARRRARGGRLPTAPDT